MNQRSVVSRMAAPVLVALLVVAGTVPAPAPAASPSARDAGSTQVAGRADGVTARSWTARDGRLRCIEAGPLPPSCSPPQLKEGALAVGHAVARPAGQPPRLGRLILAGLAGDQAVRVRVRWPGGAKVVRPGRFGAYLVVLPARTRQRDVVIAMRHRDGSQNTIDFRRSPRRMQPVAGSDRIEGRLRDATTGRPLALLVWRLTGGGLCTHVGEPVSGRVGALQGRAFFEFPINQGGNCTRSAQPTDPVSVTAGASQGHAIVSGVARADVASVELRLADGGLLPLELSRRRAFAASLRTTGADLPAVAVVAVLRDGSREDVTIGGPRPRP